MSIIMAGGIMTSITSGIPVAGGSRIIRIGFECITRNGLGTAIGMNTVTGTIATGGKNTTPDGRISTITIGSSI